MWRCSAVSDGIRLNASQARIRCTATRNVALLGENTRHECRKVVPQKEREEDRTGETRKTKTGRTVRTARKRKRRLITGETVSPQKHRHAASLRPRRQCRSSIAVLYHAPAHPKWQRKQKTNEDGFRTRKRIVVRRLENVADVRCQGVVVDREKRRTQGTAEEQSD